MPNEKESIQLPVMQAKDEVIVSRIRENRIRLMFDILGVLLRKEPEFQKLSTGAADLKRHIFA